MLKFVVIATRGPVQTMSGPFNTYDDAESFANDLASNTNIREATQDDLDCLAEWNAL